MQEKIKVWWKQSSYSLLFHGMTSLMEKFGLGRIIHLFVRTKAKKLSGLGDQKGFGLVETMMAIAILGIVVMSLASVMEFVTITSVKSREQTHAVNISQRFFTRLNNIPYPYVFSCNSSSANYGLNGTFGPVTNQVSTYPYIAVFNELRALMSVHRFDKFTLDIKFAIRDLGDLDSDGQTIDLRYFADSNGDLSDDYDSGVRYFNQNGDGDYRDIYGTPQITEEPHTRLKEATLKLYKKGQLIFQDIQLISWEKFTGVEGKAAGATLTIMVSTPSENSIVYSLAQTHQQNSYNLTITKTASEPSITQRADASLPLRIIGETTPNATLSWKLGASTNSTLDTCSADLLGQFDCSVSNLTNNLVEGTNTLFGQATKTVYYSPWNPTTFIRELSTPTITAQTPTGTIPNLQPTVRATILDQPLTAGRVVSGINSDLITFFNGTTTVNHTYDNLTGYVTWIDSITALPPILSDGSYTMILEGGDNAGYKARSTWTFTISVGMTDHSAPSISNKDPIGIAASNPPTISCRVFDNQSGIILNSVVLSLDGVVMVSSGIGNLATACAALTQQDGYTVSYIPDSVLTSGSHSVAIQASHWATNPTNKISSQDTWLFNVP
ncbi:MAG: hypothetical protein A3I11_03195 [Elusimicrobia bacterium RIFCSPLOWO2_02_FULL_39_32]|nr:MAG: hypothetical protein A2034_00795 [Elusimicrobia bacterium GWA2_38_7]OGR79389.1 MAG: hypothetical protein A3B80_01765 [Elusimicrobia bacterium RIFCSPHIGHO2_02_FULL_39_36]OGR92717.1 MAG: hypothetical protein A3I11_03195 [Elusimicrobia bacterium RIFCSPLOWO2_02_FULL_39_32]